MKNKVIDNNDSEFINNTKKRRGTSKNKQSKKSTGMPKHAKVLIIVVLVLIILALGCFAAFKYFKDFHRPSGQVDESQNSGVDQQIINPETGEVITMQNTTYTFLATGCDKSEGLTDVIMVALYDTDNDKVSIMSIPRDTYVKSNSKLLLDDDGVITKANFDKSANGSSRINAVYTKGKNFGVTVLEKLEAQASDKDDAEIAKLCESSCLDIDAATLKAYMNERSTTKKKALQSDICKRFGQKYLSMLIYYNYGIPIDYYAMVNLSGFRNIVDAIGGVDVVIQQDMYYNDPTQNLLIDLKAGPQHLDGKKAEQFVRFRYGYINADIGRIDAQKIFMTAFINKICSFDIVTKIPKIIEEIQNNLMTNLSLSDTLWLATNALEIDLNSISMITLPGTAGYYGEASYFSANKQKVIETVNEYFNKYNRPLPQSSFAMVEIFSDKPMSSDVLTAEDISQNRPHLNFTNGGSVTGNSGNEPGTDEVTENTDPSDNDETGNDDNSENNDENRTDELPEDTDETNDTDEASDTDQGTQNTGEENADSTQDTQTDTAGGLESLINERENGLSQ